MLRDLFPSIFPLQKFNFSFQNTSDFLDVFSLHNIFCRYFIVSIPSGRVFSLEWFQQKFYLYHSSLECLRFSLQNAQEIFSFLNTSERYFCIKKTLTFFLSLSLLDWLILTAMTLKWNIATVLENCVLPNPQAICVMLQTMAVQIGIHRLSSTKSYPF